MSETKSAFVSTDSIRLQFSEAMSDMYKQEVPLYGDLLELVNATNTQVLDEQPLLASQLSDDDHLSRLSVERHGAIRLGSSKELNMMRRLLAVMGMHPVSYYDLSVAGVPVHATAFRPVTDAALHACPFRLFTSLLRLELISDPESRELARELIEKRDIFTDRARELVAAFEACGGLTEPQVREFVAQALQTFKWHSQSTVTSEQYSRLNAEHRLVADIAAFKGPHINHLTPRTLDIDRVQALMPSYGIDAKALIEGPPLRRCPILLRQTSFKALEEAVAFTDQNDAQGRHTARFGEIEQRGIALTRKGRELYDQLLTQAKAAHTSAGGGPATYGQHLEKAFTQIPDDYRDLRTLGLAYFRYSTAQPADAPPLDESWNVEALLEHGYLTIAPLIYEDFLPVSAAGIFQSNLGEAVHGDYGIPSNQTTFEAALGLPVLDEFELYDAAQAQSLENSLKQLKTIHG
ncbi:MULTISPECIES: VOC family protein [unclassified Pseudomonas]|uniref:2-oxoadipate dioxygenase/decarboxylase HglS n=1 Tax=unclassified Pseudomonas TaxID=196821 RepID=UPI000D37875C|nr:MULTISPECIES: VOC family protein [unclassified Pseudomonas]RAU43831.1 VOC family protein [Pseudomonas sp. RIT 409]RAU56275.1 VOC family protein [Pseudomonas sp. RIT 412]